MSRIFLVLFLLIHCGCGAMKTSVAEYSSFSLTTECSSVRIQLAMSVDESNVFRCECEGDGVEIVGLIVRLFALEDGEHWFLDEGKLKCDDDVHSVL